MNPSHKQNALYEARAGWGWLSQAISGLLLVGLLGLHWVAQHYLASGGLRSFSEVVAYLRNPLALLLELSFLAIVTYHALTGVRAILLDLGPGKRLMQVLDFALFFVSLATVLYGIQLVVDIMAY